MATQLPKPNYILSRHTECENSTETDPQKSKHINSNQKYHLGTVSNIKFYWGLKQVKQASTFISHTASLSGYGMVLLRNIIFLKIYFLFKVQIIKLLTNISCLAARTKVIFTEG